MPYSGESRLQYLATAGQTTFVIPSVDSRFSELFVTKNGSLIDEGVAADEYTNNGNGTISFNTACELDDAVECYRLTEIEARQVEWNDAALGLASAHNRDGDQLLALIQEIYDLAANSIKLSGAEGFNWDSEGLELRNLADGTESDSASTKGQLDAEVDALNGDMAVLQSQVAGLTNLVDNLEQLIQNVIIGEVSKPWHDVFVATLGQTEFGLTKFPFVGPNPTDWQGNIRVVWENNRRTPVLHWSYDELNNKIITTDSVPENTTLIVYYDYV